MFKYYAFNVKSEIVKLYQDREIDIYILLKKICMQNDSNNINLRISIFNQMFDVFMGNILCDYLDNKINLVKKGNKYIFNIKESFEKTIIEIHYSTIIIITNVKNPIIFKSLKYIYKNIFICDFDNNKYMFLNN